MACFESKQWSTTSSLLLETIKPPRTTKNPNKSRKNIKKKHHQRSHQKPWKSHGSFMGIPIQNKAKTQPFNPSTTPRGVSGVPAAWRPRRRRNLRPAAAEWHASLGMDPSFFMVCYGMLMIMIWDFRISEDPLWYVDDFFKSHPHISHFLRPGLKNHQFIWLVSCYGMLWSGMLMSMGL